MKCPNCQHENRAGAKFCEECATALARTCTNCGAVLGESVKFCINCAHPVAAAAESSDRFASPELYTPKHLAGRILTSKGALEGERKQVTVLFADLKGSMELLADRDPEEARQLLDAVLERMMEAVHRYEGTVNQVMGDGIMALFGAPLALEFHAMRACYAALRMQDSVNRWAEQIQRAEGLTVRIRVGLNSGEVVVRSIGSDLHMDYTAVGQTTHLAARMEQMATPGTIVITPSTLHMAERTIRVNPLGLRQVKGLDVPIEVYELVGAVPNRSMLSTAVAHRLSQFVGRHAELERLRQMLAEARAGRGQVAAVTAEPGLGKTRLVYEFVHSQEIEGWRLLESSSLAFDKATSYLPIIELLRRYFEIGDADSAAQITEKVVTKLSGIDPELQNAVPPILSLLDALPEDDPFRGLDARSRRRHILDALTHVILKETVREPVLIVIENLQWVDTETRVFLGGLLERIHSVRLMLILAYRPEFVHDWQRCVGYNEVPIVPLARAGAEELLKSLLGSDRSLAPLRQLLIERAQGNPFFLEELVRTLAEAKVLVGEPGAYRATSGIGNLQVPATVQAVLAARIDRLSNEEKFLLQSASVIGVDVLQALLEAVTELPGDTLRGAVSHLQAAGFLDEVGLFPDIEFRFRHALARDVAYDSLLREQRRVLHARIVEAIETLYGERLSNHLDQLAYHAIRGEVWDKAEIYNRQVGTRAVARAANQEAVRAFEAALQALGHLPQTRQTLERAIDLRLDLRPPLLQLGRLDEVLKVSREAERIARDLGDEQRLARVYTYLVNHHYLKGETALAIEYGERCLEVGRATKDVALEALARQYMGQSYLALGDFPRAERILKENVELLDESRAGTTYVASCGWLAKSLAERGSFEAAYFALERARLAAEAMGNAYSQTIAWTMTGFISMKRGYLARAVLPLERSFEACRRRNLTVWQPIPSSLLGTALVRLGHVTEGLRLLEDAVRLSGELGIRAHLPAWMVNLAEGYLADGQHTRAQAAAQEALDLARTAGERGHEAAAHAVLGNVAASGNPLRAADAFEHYDAAMRLAEQLGMRPLLAEILLDLSRLNATLGEEASAKKHRTAADDLLRDLDMRSWQDWRETEVSELGQLFIVARSNTELFELLTEELSGAQKIKVILDRRQDERRQRRGLSAAERRQAERRRSAIDEDLQNWGLAVAPSLA
jgi:class 3 adenylate cyclase/tetratricopeptide (TPR) repeat protein